MTLPIYVVNLKHDYEKREHVTSMLEGCSLSFTLIEAVEGTSLSSKCIDKYYDAELARATIGREMSPGEIGCALSHLFIYDEIINRNQSSALILEDDANIVNDIHCVLSNICKLPSDLELLLLGYHSNPHNHQISNHSFWHSKVIEDSFKLVRLSGIGYGTYGYLITLKGAKKLKKIIESEKLCQPIDHYTGKDQNINMYASIPRFIDFSEELKALSSINAERLSYVKPSMFVKCKKYLLRWKIIQLMKVTFHKVKFFVKGLLPIATYNSKD